MDRTSVDGDGALLHAYAHHGALVPFRTFSGLWAVLRVRRLCLVVGYPGVRGVREGRVAEARQRALVTLPVRVAGGGRVALHRRVTRRLVGVVRGVSLAT